MISLEYTPFLTAVRTLKKVIDARSQVPIMRHVSFDTDAFGRVVLTASDFDTWLSLTVEGSHAESEDVGFTVSRADLEKILTGGDKGKLVTMAVDHGTNRDGVATIAHDDITVDLDILPASDYPEMPLISDTVYVPMACATARDILTFCGGTMSSEGTRCYLRGVYLHQYGDTGKLAAVATDGHRLNIVETSTTYAGSGVIIPDDAVALLTHMLAKAEGSISWHLPQDSKNVNIAGKGWSLVTRRVDGTFPNYARILPQEVKGKGTLSCRTVGKAAARIARITSKQGAAIIDMQAGVVRHAGTGDGVKGIAIDAGDTYPSGDVVPVGIDSTYLEKAMGQIEAFSDTCTVRVVDENTPLRITPRQMPAWAENISTVVMPMRY